MGLDLEGYRCFESVSLSVEPGVTVIHGSNGAGKTTLLESILFGLYGSSALTDATLADVVTRGEEEAFVALSFVHSGGDYRLEREITVSGERASTRRCELVEPDGEVYEGSSDVGRRITEMLRMDGEAFVNSAYVKQGEINKLLHATPAERQSMIDELLQLGRLESYRDRADEARLAVRSLANARGDVINELESQRERIVDTDPYERLNELENEHEALGVLIDAYQDRRDELVTTRDDLEDEHAAIEDHLDQRASLVTQREELESSLTELTERRQAIRDTLMSTQERKSTHRETLEQQLADLGIEDLDAVDDRRARLEEQVDEIESVIDEHRETVEETRERAASIRERREAVSDRLESDRATKKSVCDRLTEDEAVLDERLSDRQGIETRLSGLLTDIEVEDPTIAELAARADELTADLDTHRTRLREHRDDRAALSEHIEQASELAADDRCPTCGQGVDESPHVESLDDDRRRLETLDEEIVEIESATDRLETSIEAIGDAIDANERLVDLKALIDERRAVIEERQTRIDELESAIEKAEKELDGLSRAAEATESTIETARSRIAKANERLQEVRSELHALDEVESTHETITDIDDELDRLHERRDHLDELEGERIVQLSDLDDRLETVESALEDTSPDDLEARLASINESLEATESQRSAAEKKRDSTTEALGSVRADIEQLEELDTRLERERAKQAALEDLRDEAVSLGGLYESVRSELRERNVSTLERLLNETFELLYRNDAYNRIELEPDYELSVHSKDGAVIDPSQLSGGERAIFNLSLRCAIYRLLAEGVDGSAPMPPLLLDEPTVFLDQGHVGRLIRLLETMRSFGVEQTLVVSHHEALLDAAEHRIAVEKDSTTNRSRVADLAVARPP